MFGLCAKKRLKVIREAYGPWGKSQGKDERDYYALMNHMADYITAQYGPRCPSSEGGCCVCGAWAVYDLLRATFMEPYSGE